MLVAVVLLYMAFLFGSQEGDEPTAAYTALRAGNGGGPGASPAGNVKLEREEVEQWDPLPDHNYPDRGPVKGGVEVYPLQVNSMWWILSYLFERAFFVLTSACISDQHSFDAQRPRGPVRFLPCFTCGLCDVCCCPSRACSERIECFSRSLCGPLFVIGVPRNQSNTSCVCMPGASAVFVTDTAGQIETVVGFACRRKKKWTFAQAITVDAFEMGKGPRCDGGKAFWVLSLFSLKEQLFNIIHVSTTIG